MAKKSNQRPAVKPAAGGGPRQFTGGKSVASPAKNNTGPLQFTNPGIAQAAGQGSKEARLARLGYSKDMLVAQRHILQTVAQPQAGAQATAAGAMAKAGPLNIVGSHLGLKLLEGRPTGDRAVVVLVKHKFGKDELPADQFVPPHEVVKGEKIMFDVVAVGQPWASGNGFPNFDGRRKPALCGDSIGLQGGGTGTYGCRVTHDDGGSGMLCLLTNWHVAAFNPFTREEADEGSFIVQPGDADNDGAQGFIGSLATSSHVQVFQTEFEARASFTNFVDAALVLTNQDVAAARFHKNFAFDPTPISTFEGMRVMKEGRTSGPTFGRVMSEFETAAVTISYGSPNNPSPFAHFEGQIMIQKNEGNAPFSGPGDSGSLVLGQDSDGVFHPVALLFAGATNQFGGPPFTTWANPIMRVMSDLNITSIEFDG